MVKGRFSSRTERIQFGKAAGVEMEDRFRKHPSYRKEDEDVPVHGQAIGSGRGIIEDRASRCDPGENDPRNQEDQIEDFFDFHFAVFGNRGGKPHFHEMEPQSGIGKAERILDHDRLAVKRRRSLAKD